MVPASMMSSPVHGGRPPVEALVIGGSAGSVEALGVLLPGLPADFPPVLIVVHVLATSPNPLGALFEPRCALRVASVEPGEPIERGALYFAPAGYHLLVETDRRCALSIEPPVHFSRPSIDVLFESAAEAYGPALVGVVLTGASSDGAHGLQAVHARGGRTFVQDPATAEHAVMPAAALRAVPEARVASLSGLLSALCAMELER
jgi:two-component system, chemotaxis family, protein-glutamate methylesterase/glutaminase